MKEGKTMANIQYVDVSYDFIDNGAGELMMVMDKAEGTADDEKALIIYDGEAQAMLIRNCSQIVRIPLLTTEVRAMLKDGRKILLVTEMDGEDIDNVYEVQLEVLNAPLPIPTEYNKPVSFTIDGGHTFEGDFDSEFTGKGKATSADGDVYEGDFVEGFLSGKGKKTFTDGTVYEGDFVEGIFNGKGKYTYTNGTVYEGDFVKGLFEGKGKYTDVEGSVYEGDFKDDKMNGKGKITKTDGSVLECNFVDGLITGNARYTFPDNEDTQEETTETEDNMGEMDDIDEIDPDDYDIVVNASDEIMIVMYKREGDPLSPEAYKTADKTIVLKRNTNNLITFDSLPDETFEYFTRVNTILVNEIDDEGKSIHVYDVPLFVATS
jgi:hypothetical protein